MIMIKRIVCLRISLIYHIYFIYLGIIVIVCSTLGNNMILHSFFRLIAFWHHTLVHRGPRSYAYKLLSIHLFELSPFNHFFLLELFKAITAYSDSRMISQLRYLHEIIRTLFANSLKKRIDKKYQEIFVTVPHFLQWCYREKRLNSLSQM